MCGTGSAAAVKRCAYVSLFFGDDPDIFLGLVSNGWSLRVTHQTPHDLVLMHTSDVPQQFLDILGSFWKLCRVDDLAFDHLVTKGSRESLKRLFLKLRLFELIQYAKVLFLDVDILIRKSLDDVFDVPAPAGVLYDGKDDLTENAGMVLAADDLIDPATEELIFRVNAGVLLIEPCREEFRRICEMGASWGCDGDQASFCPEEELLTRYFASQCSGLRSLHLEWNLEIYRSSQATRCDVEVARIFHFSCRRLKPWWTTWTLMTPEAVLALPSAWAEHCFNDPHGLLVRATAEWASAFLKCRESLLGEDMAIDVVRVAWPEVSESYWSSVQDLVNDVVCSECGEHPGIYEGRRCFTNCFYCEWCWETWRGC